MAKQQPDADLNGKYQYSTADVALFFGISRAAFLQWRQNPTFPKDAGGGPRRLMRWDLQKIFNWHIVNHYGCAEMAKEMQSHKLSFVEARAQEKKLQVQQLKGTLVDKNELREGLDTIFIRIKQALLLHEKRLPPMLEGKSQKKMLNIIHRETVDLLNGFVHGKNRLCR